MEDDIDGFDCGLPVVNNWLRNQLKNAGRQHTAVAYATFSNGVLAGFYTLSAYGINHAEANGWLKRNSPDPIPAILLGMLGVDIRYRTMHIGSQLLRDATLRASNAAEIVGAKALLVEPASDSALTLPTAEAGGILVSSTGCLRVHEGLTGSPQAFGLDVSRPTVCSVMFYAADSSWLRILNPSSLRLLAALTSRSWNTPHCGHVHSRTSRFLTSGLRYPQSWQSWLDG